MKMAVSADGTWLLAQCQGSGKNPYEVSCDLAEPSTPVGRCNCPSRKFPCKHSVGLMLAGYVASRTRSPSATAGRIVRQAAEAGAAKEKKAESGSPSAKGEPGGPRQKNAAPSAMASICWRKLVLDLVAGGQWFEASRLERLGRQAKQMSDAYLPGAWSRSAG